MPHADRRSRRHARGLPMTSAFDLLVLLAFFVPLGLLVALNVVTLRPPLRPGMPQPPRRVELPALDAARPAAAEEPLREAA